MLVVGTVAAQLRSLSLIAIPGFGEQEKLSLARAKFQNFRLSDVGMQERDLVELWMIRCTTREVVLFTMSKPSMGALKKSGRRPPLEIQGGFAYDGFARI